MMSGLKIVYSLRRSERYVSLSLLSVLCSLLLSVSVASAQQSSGSIAQGFQISGNSSDIVAGTLVSTKDSASQEVELATIRSASQLIGVIDKNPLLVISANKAEAQVVLSGTTNVLVSDINGSINASDKITASPIAGVGMRATAATQIVGTAQSKFNVASSQSRTIKDSAGKSYTVHIGYVPLQVGISYYQAPGSDYLPPFVQRLAASIAGRPVSLLRILLCIVLLLSSFIGMTALIYASTRAAMTSLGRNPLAAKNIRKGLYQSLIIAGSVVAASLLASYIILST